MTSLFILGVALIILQISSAIIVERSNIKSNWVKYFFSWTVMLIGLIFIPISVTLGGWIGTILASSGITMVITTLLTIPIITLTLQPYRDKKSIERIRKIREELNR